MIDYISSNPDAYHHEIASAMGVTKSTIQWSSSFKLFATKTYNHTVNKLVFIEWLNTKLLPYLKEGMVVVMDNAPWHKGNDIKYLI